MGGRTDPAEPIRVVSLLPGSKDPRDTRLPNFTVNYIGDPERPVGEVLAELGNLAAQIAESADRMYPLTDPTTLLPPGYTPIPLGEAVAVPAQ